MSVSISSELQLNVVLDSALRAFRKRIAPVAAFATVFRDVQLRGTNKVSVPYYPLEGSASKDFSGTYAFDNAQLLSKEVTVNKRKYQSLTYTSDEFRRQPVVNWEQLGAIKGEKLAEDVLADILSVVTNANFGAAVFTGAAANFDSDDIADIRVACNQAHWPIGNRSLILDSAYEGALLKDSDIKPAYASGSTDALREGAVRRLMGFDIFETPSIPANGENLVGFAVYLSAILAAFSPIEPEPTVRNAMTNYRIVTDPVSGISIEYREWGDPDTDAAKRVIEANYGYARGETAALKRVVSA